MQLIFPLLTLPLATLRWAASQKIPLQGTVASHGSHSPEMIKLNINYVEQTYCGKLQMQSNLDVITELNLNIHDCGLCIKRGNHSLDAYQICIRGKA